MQRYKKNPTYTNICGIFFILCEILRFYHHFAALDILLSTIQIEAVEVNLSGFKIDDDTGTLVVDIVQLLALVGIDDDIRIVDVRRR